MRKILLFMMMAFASTSIFAQGNITANVNPVVASQDAVFTFTAAGSSIDVSKTLFVHTWLTGTGLSKSYGTDWNAPNMAKASMTNNGDGTFSITINIKSFFNVADVDMPKVKQIGVIARDGTNQTKDFIFGVGEAIVAADRFKFDYGVEGGGSWSSVAFEKKSGSTNIFIATITVPEDYSLLKGWVGYNGGGIENPTWVQGRSLTVDFSTITGMKAGEVVLTLNLESTEVNWGLAVESTTGIDSNKDVASKCVGKLKSIEAQFEGLATIEVISITGQSISKIKAENSVEIKDLAAGAYIVKINSVAHKVLVK